MTHLGTEVVMRSSWVYILLCASGSYYTGCTTELAKRISQHKQGLVKGYTSKRLPVKVVFTQEFHDIKYAIEAERQIKGWSRKKKEALIDGNFHLLHLLAECRNVTHFRNKGAARKNLRGG